MEQPAPKPRFCSEVVWQRRTYFGNTGIMKRSQWRTVGPPNAGNAASAPDLCVPAHASSCSTGPHAGTGKRKPPKQEPWKPGSYSVGRRYFGYEHSFGTPPLAGLSDAVLRSRIQSLERGVARAGAEVDYFSREVLVAPTAHRGYVYENQAELAKELELATTEWHRRREAKRHRQAQELRHLRQVTGAAALAGDWSGAVQESAAPGGAEEQREMRRSQSVVMPGGNHQLRYTQSSVKSDEDGAMRYSMSTFKALALPPIRYMDAPPGDRSRVLAI